MITDPNAVRFCNEQIRTLADKIPAMYSILLHHSRLFTDTPELSSQFADGKVIIDDGSSVDGRRSITGGDVQALEAAVSSFVEQLEANDRALLKLALKIAVNPAVNISL